MTLPQVNALVAYWESVPPPNVQLKRISLGLGLKDTAKPKPTDAVREAMAAGLPLHEGRPADPMLDLVGL